MSRSVKGILFSDYVRMIRARKDIAWERRLQAQDIEWLSRRIEPDGWYPMETYERMGLAIFDEIAGGNLEAVREWGRRTIDTLHEAEPELFSGRDPRETFMRFQVLRQALFNFPAAQVIAIRDGKAVVEIGYGMSPRAEEAAVWQSVGFLERLIQISGAEAIESSLESRSWDGQPATRIAISWKTAPSLPPRLVE